MSGSAKKSVGVYNLYEIQRDYFIRIFDEVPGRKVLILDKPTEELLSEILTQSELLRYEVYLVELLEKLGQEKDLDTMRSVIVVAPTVQNINAICAELEGYSVTSCYIYFTGPVEDRHLEQLAQKDTVSSRIQAVKEISSNYTIINRKSFVLTALNQNELPVEDKLLEEFDMKSKLVSLLCSLRVSPTILFSTGSQKCQNLAQIVSVEMEGLVRSDSKQFTNQNVMLMIVDRNKDKLTPLKSPWLYQAMLFEHLNYRNGRIKYGGMAKKEASFTELHDSFFAESLFLNFGQIIQKTNNFVKATSEESTAHNEGMKTLEDMEYIAEMLPELKRRTNQSRKHFEMIESLSEVVTRNKLMDISQTEVQIIDTKLGLHIFDNVRNYVLSTETRPCDKVRLVMMFLQKFPDDPLKTKILCNDLEGLDVPKERVDYLRKMFSDLRAKEEKGRLDQILSSVKNMLEDCQSHLVTLANSLAKLKIDPRFMVPVTSATSSPTLSPFKPRKPNLLILFVVGGITLHELCELQVMKECDIEVLAGGSHLLNSKMFMNQVFGEVVFKTGD